MNRRTRIGVTLWTAAALGCGDNTGPRIPPPAAVQPAAGDAQTAVVGAPLAASLVAKVLDASGRPIQGVDVSWTVTVGTGSVNPASATTDVAGTASAVWTLGTTAGDQQVAVTAGTVRLVFRATAIAGPPASIQKNAGDAQTGAAGEVLPQPLAVLVADAYGNPVAGAAVAWQVTAGGGNVTPASATTGTDGKAATSWKLGTRAGDPQTMNVQVASLAVQTFSSTARPGPAASIIVTPSNPRVQPGNAVQFSAQMKDAYDNVISDRSPIWSSTEPGVASIDATGSANAIAPGPTQVKATADGRSGSASLTVLAAVAPSINSVSPVPLTPGASVMINGTGFSPARAGNIVTVDGVAAAVTSATPTQLAITVPPRGSMRCEPTRSVTITVTVPELPGTSASSLQVANRVTLAVGQSVLLGADVAGCNEIDLTGGAYLVTVFNPARSASTSSPFRLRGVASGNSAAIASLLSPGGTTAIPFAPRQQVQDPAKQRAAEIHDRLLEEGRRLYARYRPAMRQMQTRVTRVPPPQVGDLVPLRIPNINGANLCGSYFDLMARVVYVGAQAVVLEDVAVPMPRAIDAQLAALGAEYDQRMHGILTTNFGNPLAMDARLDANDHVFMLFTKRVTDMGGSGLAGFVWSGDFVPRSECPASNTAEVFYARVPQNPSEINSWYLETPATVIHEMKHVTSNAERFSRNASVLEDSWLEEGTAQIAIELWARAIFGYSQRGNVNYSSSLSCELRCADKPFAMLDHFIFLYQYYQNVHRRSILGKVNGSEATYYGSAWLFVRWVIDHFSPSEPAFLSALTQQTAVAGLTNLEARAQRSFEELLGLWSLSLYTDDLPIAMRPELQHPSWNINDIFRGLNTDAPSLFPYSFPLVGYNVSFGSFVTDVIENRAGSATYFYISGAQGSRQLLDLQGYAGSGTTPSSLRLAVVRVQ